MSREEASDIPLRELIRQHINKSEERHTMLMSKMSAVETHLDYGAKKMESQDLALEKQSTRIKAIEDADTKRKGAVLSLSIITTLLGIWAAIKTFFLK